MNRKVLIITYYWPPGSSPGVQRWLKLSKYLLDLGWAVSVLTVKNGAYPAVDDSLLKEVDDRIKVVQAPTLEPFTLFNILRGKSGKKVGVGMADLKEKKGLLSRVANLIRANLFVPDARRGWAFFATKAAQKWIEKEQIPLVVTTGPPQSTHLIGKTLKRKVPGLRWHADFRDPWVNVYYNEFLNRSSWAQAWDQQLEDAVLSTADSVSVIGHQMQLEFKDRNPQTHIVFNGYDRHDFSEPESLSTEVFTLKYIGGLKGNQNVKAFWEAIAALVHESNGQYDQLRIELTGYITTDVEESIQEFNLSEIVKVDGFVPHDEAVRRMQSANILLLLIPQTRNSKLIITGKIFEYLATARPILGIGPPDGDAAAILKDCSRAPMFGFQNRKGIQSFIAEHYKNWEDNGRIQLPINGKTHLKYSRSAQAKEMHKLLSQLIDS